jgi:hypothetical protein
MPSPADPFRRLRFFRGLLLVLWIGFIPYGAVLNEWLVRSRGNNALLIWFLLPYGAAFAYAGLQIHAFRCPSCDRSFCYKDRRANIFTRKCLWCGHSAAR